jgi:hypothetical protein
MKKEDVLELAKDERFISGIYNYCDRWCERCPFTSRCMNFALDDEQLFDPQSHDIRNEAFWRRLSETFRVTLELVHDLAEREGIDLDGAGDVDEEEEKLKDELASSQKCCRMAQAYSDMVGKWFDTVAGESDQAEDDWQSEMDIPLPDEGPLGTNAPWEDGLEVVRWYQHQIYVKLMRATRGALREDDRAWDEFAKDSDGSAKVALIGIERSIAAWGELRPFFLAHEREVFHIVVHLEGLRKEVERVFPAARQFIRPGFDEMHLNS